MSSITDLKLHITTVEHYHDISKAVFSGTLAIIFLRSQKHTFIGNNLIYCWSHSGDKKIPLHCTPHFYQGTITTLFRQAFFLKFSLEVSTYTIQFFKFGEGGRGW